MTDSTRGQESWQRAMGLVAGLITAGSKKRYRVYGYRIEDGWWAYSFRKVPKRPHVVTEPIQMSDQVIAELSATLPRCAERARAEHGGGFKLAILDERTARAMGQFLGMKFYRCELPAPAIGTHWHLSSRT